MAADADDRPVAYIDLEPDGHINRLFCAPEAVGQGIASRLYDVVEAAAREQGIKSLFTEASELARRLFERKGFVVIERQDLVVRSVAIHNYRMAKALDLRNRTAMNWPGGPDCPEVMLHLGRAPRARPVSRALPALIACRSGQSPRERRCINIRIGHSHIGRFLEGRQREVRLITARRSAVMVGRLTVSMVAGTAPRMAFLRDLLSWWIAGQGALPRLSAACQLSGLGR